ncbi:hypothetical protein IWQ57_001920, partial [Coemansia nantahalensis]
MASCGKSPRATGWLRQPSRILAGLWQRVRREGPHSRPAANAQPSLAYALFQMAPGHVLRALAARLVAELVPVFIPLLVKLATVFAQHKRHAARHASAPPSPPAWQGYVFVTAMFAMLLLYSWAFQWFFYEIGKATIIVRSALVSAIYRKSLLLSAQARARLTSGKLTNLISTDIGQVERGVMNVVVCVTIPVQVVVSIVVLAYMIGPPGIAGWALVVAFVPIQMWAARFVVALRSKAMAYTDSRIRSTREALQGVRVVKAFAWEESVLENVRRVRAKELGAIARLNLVRYCLVSLSLHAPVFAAVVTFAIVALAGGTLKSGPVFAAIGIFNAMSLPMSWLPGALTEARNTRVPLGRIADALLEEELAPMPRPSLDLDVAIRIARGTFAWDHAPSNTALRAGTCRAAAPHRTAQPADGSDETHGNQASAGLRSYRFPQPDGDAAVDSRLTSSFVLRDINIEIPRGSLVAIVGVVGSGKSSLASAIAGEMCCVSGSVSYGGALSYAPQTPWIVSGTIRDNILFGSLFDLQHYTDVIEACELEADLACLPDGDQTEIGERGATLSGGQKQRVSIARAVYSDSNILVLDDCLSAVDVKTSRAIFKHCMRGLAAHKTRILVTSSLDYLPSADLVITLDAGRVAEYGTFSDLLAAGGATASLYASFAESGPARHLPDTDHPYATDSSLHTATPIRETADARSFAGQDADDEHERRRRLSAPAYASLAAGAGISRSASVSSGGGSDTSDLGSRSAGNSSATSHPTHAEKGCASGSGPGRLDEPSAARRNVGATMSQEERATGQITWKAYLAYIRAGGGFLLLAALVACLAVALGCRVGGDFWLRAWVRHRHRHNATSVPMDVGIYALLGGLQFLWFWLFSLLLVASVYLSSTRLHALAFERVLRSPMAFFDTVPLGRILNRFTRDIDSADLALCDFFRQFYQNVGRSIGAFVTIALIVPIVLAPLIPLTVVSWGLVYIYLRTSVEVQRIAAISRSPLYAHYAETLQGLSTIRAHNAQHRFVAKADQALDDANTPYWYSLAVQNWVWLRVDFISHLLTLAVCIVVIAQPSRWDAAAVGLILVQATQMGSYATYAGRGWSELQNNMNAVERLDHYATALPQEPSRTQQEAGGKAVSVRTATRAWPERGTIIIRGLSMRYRPGLPLALSDVNMEVYSGERVGIIGRSGAGKSSIVAALFRLVEPSGGTVFIDGVDTQTLPLARLRRAIGILPQDPVLFSGSVRANIDPVG